MPIDDREQQFERALARHLREAAGACPDAEILAAYHERTLSLKEMAKWKEHITACERCQEALALVEQTEAVDSEEWKEQDFVVPQKAAATAAAPRALSAGIEKRVEVATAPIAVASSQAARPERQRRANWKWIAPIGAIAAGVLVWVGSVELQKKNQPASQSVQIAQNRPQEAPPPLAIQMPSPATRTDQLTQKQEEDKALRDEGAARTAVPKIAAKSSAPMSAPEMNASGGLPEVRGQLDKKKDATGEGFGSGTGAAPAPKAPSAVSSEMKAEGNDIVSVSQGASVSGGQMNAPMAGAKAARAPAAPPPDRARSAMTYKSAAGFVGGNLSAITGSVLDPSGAAISGAVITAIDTSNGSSKTAVADAAGKFQLTDLPSDTYRLIVAQNGFATSEQMVALQPKQNEQLNIQLKLGTSSQTVEVTAGAAAINTSSAEVSKEAAARKLPMNGRNSVALTQLAAANPQYIASPDQKAGWRVGEAGKIDRTTDNGKTWTAQTSGVSVDLRTGSASSGKVCWVVGKAGAILLTTDGGKHWKQITSPIAEDLGGVHAVDAQHASIWDVPNHQSFETSDGGTTWRRTANE